MSLARCAELLADLEPVRVRGRVRQAIGLVVQAEGLALPVGAACEIRIAGGGPPCPARSSASATRSRCSCRSASCRASRRGDEVVCRSAGPARARRPRAPRPRARLAGHAARRRPAAPRAPCSRCRRARRIRSTASASASRSATGVRAIDAPAHAAARASASASSPAPASARARCSGMMRARHRGRRHRDRAWSASAAARCASSSSSDLGARGPARSVVVVATSDAPALVRVRAPFAATAIAEYFRDQGARRAAADGLAHALRAWRSARSACRPASRPRRRATRRRCSRMLPRLLERAGRPERGPHHRALHGAGRGRRHQRADRRRGAVDPRRPRRALARARRPRPLSGDRSCCRASRALMSDVVAAGAGRGGGSRLRALLATYRDAEDLINVGAYVRGSQPGDRRGGADAAGHPQVPAAVDVRSDDPRGVAAGSPGAREGLRGRRRWLKASASGWSACSTWRREELLSGRSPTRGGPSRRRSVASRNSWPKKKKDVGPRAACGRACYLDVPVAPGKPSEHDRAADRDLARAAPGARQDRTGGARGADGSDEGRQGPRTGARSAWRNGRGRKSARSGSSSMRWPWEARPGPGRGRDARTLEDLLVDGRLRPGGADRLRGGRVRGGGRRRRPPRGVAARASGTGRCGGRSAGSGPASRSRAAKRKNCGASKCRGAPAGPGGRRAAPPGRGNRLGADEKFDRESRAGVQEEPMRI